jgi:hypothetical protein
VASFAQGWTKAEFFGGVSVADYQFDTTSAPCCSTALVTNNFDVRMAPLGWHGSATTNLRPWLGLTADYSGYSSGASSQKSFSIIVPSDCGPDCIVTDTTQITLSSPSIQNFLFGPRFTFPAGKVRIDAHFLIGARRESLNVADTETLSWTGPNGGSSISTSSLKNSITQFAAGFGGSVDYPIRKNLNWRVGADYLTNQGTGQNNARISTGLVWLVGTRTKKPPRVHVRP